MRLEHQADHVPMLTLALVACWWTERQLAGSDVRREIG